MPDPDEALRQAFGPFAAGWPAACTPSAVPHRPEPPPTRMTLVDGLRAIAALVVVLPHAWALFGAAADRSPAVRDVVYAVRVRGTLGVQVFFVLSGFVIAYSLRHTRVTAGYFARFVARRSVRLDPAYWVAIAVCCGVLWFGRHVAYDAATTFPTAGQVLATAAYLQQFLNCNDAVNHTYWTLCQEVQMYLAFCGAIGLLQAARVPYRPVLTVAFLASLAWPLAWPVPWVVIGVRGTFFPYAYGFLAGAVAWWTVAGDLPRWAVTATFGLAVVAAARNGDDAVWVVVATAGLLAVTGRRGHLWRWLDHRPLQSIGRSSYGLYLLHNPVIWLALIAQHRRGWTSLPAALAILAAVCVAAVAAAWAMHLAVERPCLRLAQRLRPPTARPDVPLVPG